jgi:hypothetical protein
MHSQGSCDVAGQPCCQADQYSTPTCNGNFFCGNGLCVACGGPQQPCCSSSQYDSDDIKCPGVSPGVNQTLTCAVLEDYEDEYTAPETYACIPCGKKHQTCCVGDITGITSSSTFCEVGFACVGQGVRVPCMCVCLCVCVLCEPQRTETCQLPVKNSISLGGPTSFAYQLRKVVFQGTAGLVRFRAVPFCAPLSHKASSVLLNATAYLRYARISI